MRFSKFPNFRPHRVLKANKFFIHLLSPKTVFKSKQINPPHFSPSPTWSFFPTRPNQTQTQYFKIFSPLHCMVAFYHPNIWIMSRPIRLCCPFRSSIVVCDGLQRLILWALPTVPSPPCFFSPLFFENFFLLPCKKNRVQNKTQTQIGISRPVSVFFLDSCNFVKHRREPSPPLHPRGRALRASPRALPFLPTPPLLYFRWTGSHRPHHDDPTLWVSRVANPLRS